MSISKRASAGGVIEFECSSLLWHLALGLCCVNGMACCFLERLRPHGHSVLPESRQGPTGACAAAATDGGVGLLLQQQLAVVQTANPCTTTIHNTGSRRSRVSRMSQQKPKQLQSNYTVGGGGGAAACWHASCREASRQPK